MTANRYTSIVLTLAASTCMGAVPSVSTEPVLIRVSNPLPQPRTEMIEVDAEGRKAGSFIISDMRGSEVPYQVCYDNKIIFPVSIGPNAESVYTIKDGRPSPVDPVACAGFYPERIDDIAWENDFAAYRAYGPAFGATGGQAYGYDAWTKSTSRPVVADRYFKELTQMVSYHVDHGDGMDVYDVGPTMGAGLAAPLLRNGDISYAPCFNEWEILDNGPLRTTIRLKLNYGGGTETRLITLDAGNPFNRTTTRFNGFESDSVAAGIVIHKPREKEYTLGANYVACTDPTTSPGGRGVGVIFTGVLTPVKGTTTSFRPFDKPKGKAVGHAMTVTPYRQGEEFTYYWGTCWNKGRINSADQWILIIEDYARRLASPLKITATTN